MRNLELDRLEKQRAEFFDQLEKLPNDLLNNQNNNSWSITQHLYHTWLAETSTEQYIRTKTKYPDLLKKMSFAVYLRTSLLRFFLKLGVRVKAPVSTSTFPEKIDLKILNSQWSDSRKSFQNLINSLEEKKLNNKAIFRHPLMGRLNMKLTLYFFNFHFKHHQKIINNLKNL